ncbi:MAG: Stp1/IreP family PP2C-type Ser/Thr phosphatase [Oscillospiraceae bacterium]|nr:Stp1/IreP family PP2C-type Ser/Thr phosphatase [Oscillospiraceae bacterium]
MKFAGRTDIGLQRLTNEDCYAILNLQDGAVVALVCDGMGGECGGGIASSIARDIIIDKLTGGYNSAMSGSEIEELLKSSVRTANSEIYQRAKNDISLDGMGTTAVIALVNESVSHIVHIGDSRAYLCSEGKLYQLTRDHSVVQDMVEKGVIEKEEARIHPRKNLITRAVGIELDPCIDYMNTSANREYNSADGQKLLLCSDGLTNCCEESDITKILQNDEISLEQMCDELINCANKNGGVDNITAVLLRL